MFTGMKLGKTIKSKLIAMGIGALMAVLLMLGLFQYSKSESNSAQHDSNKARDFAEMRLNQLSHINRFEYNLTQYTLVAMDSIIDRNEGEVSQERLKEMGKRVGLLNDAVPLLFEIADTDEEKKAGKYYTVG